MGPMMNMMNNISYLLAAVAGGYLVVGGPISIGTVFSFLQYMRKIGQPLNQIATLFNTFQSALAASERVFAIMDEPEEQDDLGAQDIGEIEGGIEFRGVDFSYDGQTEVLKNADIEAKPGQQIAIVGPTGAGKTTIISLLMRFYDKQMGEILVDGKPVESFTRESLRKNVGMVLQDTYLFSYSVKDNIRYGRPDATDEEVIAAAKMANAHSFIMHLPEGYDTLITENGSSLSQGQRQLLAIARAVLADPRMLILDEATSSIDTRTELMIQEAMLELMKGRTSFIIAHRLSTIRNADKILVIDDGEVVESGTHDELLSKEDGFYAYLYNSQYRTGMAI
jgi:ATP-binding cassette subfamily B multidrug efflux pump